MFIPKGPGSSVFKGFLMKTTGAVTVPLPALQKKKKAILGHFWERGPQNSEAVVMWGESKVVVTRHFLTDEQAVQIMTKST